MNTACTGSPPRWAKSTRSRTSPPAGRTRCAGRSCRSRPASPGRAGRPRSGRRAGSSRRRTRTPAARPATPRAAGRARSKARISLSIVVDSPPGRTSPGEAGDLARAADRPGLARRSRPGRAGARGRRPAGRAHRRRESWSRPTSLRAALGSRTCRTTCASSCAPGPPRSTPGRRSLASGPLRAPRRRGLSRRQQPGRAAGRRRRGGRRRRHPAVGHGPDRQLEHQRLVGRPVPRGRRDRPAGRGRAGQVLAATRRRSTCSSATSPGYGCGPARRVVVADPASFPTDLYVLQGVSTLTGAR